jgi:hypothetical protein
VKKNQNGTKQKRSSTSATTNSQLTKPERCKLVEKIFVIYPRFKALKDEIAHCHEYSKISADPECMFLGGLSGSGKTTLLETYAEMFPVSIDKEGMNVPVLLAGVPAKANEKTLAAELLLMLGDPPPHVGPAHELTRRLRGLLKDCGTLLVFLDEFQHFFDKDSAKVLRRLSDWLKDLIDRTHIPFVLAGMPYAEKIFREPFNDQLLRRFPIRRTLGSFGFVTKEDRLEFRAFLKALDQQLPFAQISHLSDPEVALRIYCATGGRVGKIMPLIRRAGELGINQGAPYIDASILADAYDDRLRQDQPDKTNSFRVQFNELRPEPFLEEESPPKATSGRLKRKQKQERAADVLKRR